MYCKNCGKEMNAGAAVCLNCGAESGSNGIFCAHCGNEMNANAKVCIKCGYSISTSPAKTENDTEIHCTNCGKTMKSLQAICLSCGAKNGTGRKFCRSCGTAINEGAAICLGCGCAVTGKAPSTSGSSSSGIDTDKIMDGIKNINVDSIKDGINNLNTEAITEHKYSKYFGIAGGALVVLSYILPFFTMSIEMIDKKESLNGFLSIAGKDPIEGIFTMVFPLIFMAFVIICQFVKPLEKFKSLSNLISGAGSFIFLIISAIVAFSNGNELIKVSLSIGFFIAIIVSLALAAYGLILFAKKK